MNIITKKGKATNKGVGMQKNKINSVVFLKDVESNIIEEAIIVVKGNIKIDSKENKINNNTILKEAEMIVNSKIEESDRNFLQYKIDKLIKKNSRLKILNILMTIILVILFLT